MRQRSCASPGICQAAVDASRQAARAGGEWRGREAAGGCNEGRSEGQGDRVVKCAPGPIGCLEDADAFGGVDEVDTVEDIQDRYALGERADPRHVQGVLDAEIDLIDVGKLLLVVEPAARPAAPA